MDRSIIAESRRHLGAIPCWIDDEAWANSRAYYGCPPRLRHVVDLPINEEPTYTDALLVAARHLGPEISYLEVGVSLGKNFWVLASALDQARLVGFDWERINPVLEARLDAAGGEGPLRHYRLGENRVSYLHGDLFHPEDWRALAGERFQLVFLDAIDRAEAALFQVERLLELHLLDPERFCLVWDDLEADEGGDMSRAFFRVAEQLRRDFAVPAAGVFRLVVNSTLGQHEPPHYVGVIHNAGLTPGAFT